VPPVLKDTEQKDTAPPKDTTPPPIVEHVDPASPVVITPEPKNQTPEPSKPVVETQAPPPAVVAKSDEPPQSNYEKAKTLWLKAIDAEVKKDYAEAVRCYEEIKKLDKSVWPKTLDMRLDEAKRQLPQG
jgi:hypothetical protein